MELHLGLCYWWYQEVLFIYLKKASQNQYITTAIIPQRARGPGAWSSSHSPSSLQSYLTTCACLVLQVVSIHSYLLNLHC